MPPIKPSTRGVSFTTSNEGKRLFEFLTTRGRIGQRFAPRFWEKEATLGRDRELFIVTCKKWHVAKRLLDQFSQVTNLPLPRYVSMKAAEGNVRRGPSLTHRIDWVFKRRGMPLQITAEYGNWRKVQDRDGA